MISITGKTRGNRTPLIGCIAAGLLASLFAQAASAQLPDRLARMFDAPLERWAPDQTPLAFDWAAHQPGDPLKAVVLVPRWSAYEVMELTRRLEMEVGHIYFDRGTQFWDPRAWHYSAATGKRPLAAGLHLRRAESLLRDEQAQVFLVAGIESESGAIPKDFFEPLLEQVAQGKGLVIVGDPDYAKGWPAELFETPDPALAEALRGAFDWERLPGYRAGEPGRGAVQSGHLTAVKQEEPPPLIQSYRHGEGRVVVVQFGWTRPHVAMHRESTRVSLVPLTYDAEGLEGATDRALAGMARVVLAAAGREPAATIEITRPDEDDSAPALGVEVRSDPSDEATHLHVRIQDHLDRTLLIEKRELPLEDDRLALPRGAAGGTLFVDLVAMNGRGESLAFTSRVVSAPPGPRIAAVRLPLASPGSEALTPAVALPEGGELTATVELSESLAAEEAAIHWEVSDVLGRVVARGISAVQPSQAAAEIQWTQPRPITLYHTLDAVLKIQDQSIAAHRQRFTLPMAEASEDGFKVVMWGTKGGEPVSRKKHQRLYAQGVDALMVNGFTRFGLEGDRSLLDREYSMVARSGLEVIPYATRIHGQADKNNHRVPSLHDDSERGWLARESRRLAMIAEQGLPYALPAVNLGDENYLLRYGTAGGSGEVDYSPEAIAAFRVWLQEKYETPERLNAAWGSDYTGFDQVQPMLVADAAEQQDSYAPWLEHRLFMDESFTGAHEHFARVIRETAPGSRVGWEGLYGFGQDEFDWRLGYDYAGLTRNLDLNVTYIGNWLSSELTRSFTRPGALSGKWGNQVANNEAGFAGHLWDCLLAGMNSAWWWHSWGSSYTPFEPNLELNDQGRWFFSAAREIKSGLDRLLLSATRDDSGIGVLYAPRDMYASVLVGRMAEGLNSGGTRNYWEEQAALLRGIKDLGYQYSFVSLDDLESGALTPPRYRVLFLSYPLTVSDAQAGALREFVAAGGTLVVNGRAGLLTDAGRIRDVRALDELLGVESPAGYEALKAPSHEAGVATLDGALQGVDRQVTLGGELRVELLDPALRVTEGTALARADDAPAVITHRTGEGVTVLANFSWRQPTPAEHVLLERRLSVRIDDENRLDLLQAILESAGLETPAEVAAADHERPRAVEQVVFQDGGIRYLAIQQDLLLMDLPAQTIDIALQAPAVVYDVRRGERVSGEALNPAEGSHVPFGFHQWQAEISRGNPLLYAILPYQVTGVEAVASQEGQAATQWRGTVRVQTLGGPAQRHVVRMNVYAPGSDRPHRDYSQTLSCPHGAGSWHVPFALSDASGKWRLEFRDVASGVTSHLEVQIP